MPFNNFRHVDIEDILNISSWTSNFFFHDAITVLCFQINSKKDPFSYNSLKGPHENTFPISSSDQYFDQNILYMNNVLTKTMFLIIGTLSGLFPFLTNRFYEINACNSRLRMQVIWWLENLSYVYTIKHQSPTIYLSSNCGIVRATYL